jgi:two-component system, OmpR family, alkaline phosphatase synthesis response regulator PhoP
MAQILLIEDNEKLAFGLRSNLEYEGHEVAVAVTAREGMDALGTLSPDLIILDLMLPDTDGYRVLRQLREAGDTTPVLILTALGEEADKVRGFRFGADDYVTKPFGLLELIARVDALLRRTARTARPAGAKNGTESFGEIRVDRGRHIVTRRGEAVSLRPKEFDLLIALLDRKGEVATRLELLKEVWGYDEAVMSRTVDTHVAELRRKLEDDPANPRHILTVLKTGYRLNTRGDG